MNMDRCSLLRVYGVIFHVQEEHAGLETSTVPAMVSIQQH